MINKILGLMIVIVSLAGVAYGIFLIPNFRELGWQMLATSLFAILVGVVVYRKGIKAAVTSVHDGTSKELR